MVSTIVSTPEFIVSIETFTEHGDVDLMKVMDELTFMQASDYFEQAVEYFKFELLTHPEWFSVQIEISSTRIDSIEVVEIKR